MAPVLKDNSDWLVKFAQGVMLAADILATYPLATKIMEIGAGAEGLTAVLALNPWALLITGVLASGAIIYKTPSDTRANLERAMRTCAARRSRRISWFPWRGGGFRWGLGLVREVRKIGTPFAVTGIFQKESDEERRSLCSPVRERCRFHGESG